MDSESYIVVKTVYKVKKIIVGVIFFISLAWFVFWYKYIINTTRMYGPPLPVAEQNVTEFNFKPYFNQEIKGIWSDPNDGRALIIKFKSGETLYVKSPSDQSLTVDGTIKKQTNKK